MAAAVSAGSKVIVTMPKFKMTQEFELRRHAGAMGMPQAFTSRANFSGMTGKSDFAISAVIHKAYVDVNEEGTEAAAATAVTMRALAMRSRQPPPITFLADHPFIFLIRDNHSSSILFMGRMADPAVKFAASIWCACTQCESPGVPHYVGIGCPLP